MKVTCSEGQQFLTGVDPGVSSSDMSELPSSGLVEGEFDYCMIT